MVSNADRFSRWSYLLQPFRRRDSVVLWISARHRLFGILSRAWLVDSNSSELQHTCIGLDEEVVLCQSTSGKSAPGEASKPLLFAENWSIPGNSSGCEAGEAFEMLWSHSQQPTGTPPPGLRTELASLKDPDKIPTELGAQRSKKSCEASFWLTRRRATPQDKSPSQSSSQQEFHAAQR